MIEMKDLKKERKQENKGQFWKKKLARNREYFNVLYVTERGR